MLREVKSPAVGLAGNKMFHSSWKLSSTNHVKEK